MNRFTGKDHSGFWSIPGDGGGGTTPKSRPDSSKSQQEAPRQPITVYANIKADEEAQRRGKSAVATPEQTLKFVFNPLPIPGRGDKDAETGAGNDPAQGTVRRTGKIEFSGDDRGIYHFPSSGYQFGLDYVPKNEQGLIGYTMDGKLPDYQPNAASNSINVTSTLARTGTEESV
jgi:hypothetical protein